jgi:NTE family protein
MNAKFTHLILSGGGLSGLVYIGVYRFLKEYNLLKDIHYMTGTSIGALFVFLFGLNVEYERIENFFIGNEGITTKTNLVGFNINNIFKFKNGLYSTERFRKYMVSFLDDMEDITFNEYMKRTGVDLHISVACLNTHSHLDLSNENYPDMSVITAILASMSIPIIFEPVIYNDLVLVDGGCCANLEICNIVKNISNKVLYISLISLKNFTKTELQNNLMLYGVSIMITMLSSHSKKIIEDYKDKMDIIDMMESNPVPFLQGQLDGNMFYTVIEKKQLEECIIHGYKEIHNYFTLKNYL